MDGGFGSGEDGEDPFDAFVGLLGMLNVLLGRRSAGGSSPPHRGRSKAGYSAKPPALGAKHSTRSLQALAAGQKARFTLSPIRARLTRWRRPQLAATRKAGRRAASRLGVKGVLVQMAERGQLLALECEMPQCYHHKGRGAFDPLTTPRTRWAPSPDHYPILKSAGGKLVPANVRLSHIWCNNRDYGWRTQIRTLLAKGKSLAEIADALNSKGVPPPTVRTDGRPQWCARPTCRDLDACRRPAQRVK